MGVLVNEPEMSSDQATWWQAGWVAVGTSLLFMVFYGGAAYLTEMRDDVGTWYYEWERVIPFVPAMIVPYMSIDLFFFFAPFLCKHQAELKVLAWRLSAVVVGAAICFLIYPLKLAVERPTEVEEVFGMVYTWFTALDRPYNLCPSMHIALRTVLAAHYAKYCSGWLRAAMNFWFFLIGCSTLLLFQHHVIDVVGGFVLAVLVMYMFDGHPWRSSLRVHSGRFATVYFSLALAFAMPVAWMPKLGWLTLWPALACALVASGYLGMGPVVYRRKDGQISWPARIVLGPVLAGQWLSWKYYARQADAINHVIDGVWIGRHLSQAEAGSIVESNINAVVDVCNAFNEPLALRQASRLELPVLDLTAPSGSQLNVAVQFIERHRETGVLVHCKAGYSRSAAIVIAWLMQTGRTATKEEAIAMIRAARPRVVIRPEIQSLNFVGP